MVDNTEFVSSLIDVTQMMILETAANMEIACILVEASAKQKCPIDNGILSAAMQHDVQTSAEAIVGVVSNSMSYAPYVEKGTGIYAVDGNGRKTPWSWGNKGSKKWPGRKGWRGGRPHPFLEPARDENKEEIINILAGKTL